VCCNLHFCYFLTRYLAFCQAFLSVTMLTARIIVIDTPSNRENFLSRFFQFLFYLFEVRYCTFLWTIMLYVMLLRCMFVPNLVRDISRTSWSQDVFTLLRKHCRLQKLLTLVPVPCEWVYL